MAAWADLLDRINVYPVADADTGRNLVVSLGPLRRAPHCEKPNTLTERLLFSAKGNSGNIAARFFSGFLAAELDADLTQACRWGAERARGAVGEPRDGTMLDVFEVLPKALASDSAPVETRIDHIVQNLADSVERTSLVLPEMKAAGVVDAGALGMFLFFEGFFGRLAGAAVKFPPPIQRFRDKLRLSETFRAPQVAGHCVEMVIRPRKNPVEALERLRGVGDSFVSARENDLVRVHLHAEDTEALKKRAMSIGEILEWSDEELIGNRENLEFQKDSRSVRIVTDAAGSLTREDARRLGIELLDSYVLTGDDCIPETLARRSDIYEDLKNGRAVTTSQASAFELGQNLERIASAGKPALYLCVGSVYTGNYRVALEWKKKNDPQDRLTVMDTGAASGRLACMAMATAEFADRAKSPADVVRFAAEIADRVEEYIFPEKLRYLARSGRLSRTGAFFGDMVGFMPVVSPTAEGAKTVGVAANAKSRLAFSIDKLKKASDSGGLSLVLLEFSDNEDWVENVVKRRISELFPKARLLLRPLSLTSGVHIGPGAWAVAFAKSGLATPGI